MRYALSGPSREILHDFTQPGVLLAFDFDGTLAPIAPSPERAHMRAVTRALLRRLSAHRTCIAISGRARADLLAKMAGTGIRRLYGNHGAEPWPGAAAARVRVAAWRHTLESKLDGVPGIFIEDKKISLTVHYRAARGRAAMRERILNLARTLPGARSVPGKEAVSLVLGDAPNKGGALRSEMAHLGVTRALFVGDEETDEDAFALGPCCEVLGIRVGRHRGSKAAYYIRSQAEIDELLRALLGTSQDRAA
jgi:trehalose 6-phosphate phosphatase